MDDNAPLVWEKANQQTFREAKPRFVGGCWNNYFSKSIPSPKLANIHGLL
jgi:hypothetical protein